jgi:hypothetical protein
MRDLDLWWICEREKARYLGQLFEGAFGLFEACDVHSNSDIGCQLTGQATIGRFIGTTFSGAPNGIALLVNGEAFAKAEKCNLNSGDSIAICCAAAGGQ